MNIRLISTDAEYQEALVEIKRLWNVAPTNRSARNKMEVLAMLAHRYEREREPLPELDPVDAIKFRMEQRGLTRKDLLGIFGTTARISEIMGGRRPLTLDMIRKLHTELDIPLESLIGRTATSKRHRRTAA